VKVVKKKHYYENSWTEAKLVALLPFSYYSTQRSNVLYVHGSKYKPTPTFKPAEIVCDVPHQNIESRAQ